MSKPKLTYFDAPVSRGEECRLALHAAGVDFEDNRLSRDAWLALKPHTPFASVPTYEIPGKPVLGHANAILVLIGREHGLHPTDPFEAARHEGMMNHVEDLRAAVTPSMRMSDPEAKKAAREILARDFLPQWAAQANAQIGEGPFFAGEKLHVVDFKLLMAVRWFRGGAVDHVPSTVFDDARKLIRLHDAVDAHEAVRGWYAKSKPALPNRLVSAHMRPSALVVATPVLLALVSSAGSAHAQRSDEDVKARIAYLDERLEKGERSAARWSWAWVGIYSALAAGNFVIAGLTDSRDSRIDFIARGSLSTIGLATTVLLWPHAARATRAPRALPGDTPEQRAQKLAAYEASLAKANKGDAFGTSITAHLIGLGVNGLAGAAIAVLDERPKQGALVFAGGFIVAEIRIFTRPTPSLRTREAYEAMQPPPAISSISLFPTSNGVMALGTF